MREPKRKIEATSEHHLTIDGRKWRRTDPSIPEAFRQQLVNELMSARRAVSAALRASDALAERAARDRVQDAKIALGERGAVWWEQASEAERKVRAAATIRALLRQRAPDKTICPSDVARAIGGETWRASMQLIRDVAEELVEAGTIEVRQKGKVVKARPLKGPLRLGLRDP
ncbi:MAG: hypothetical protein RLZZ450_4262 [Pseudomonadota bacterium]